jgi:hypothetical protein
MYAPASHGYDACSMQARALLLAVPSMAMAMVGFAMFGPGAVQPFDGARIRGGPMEGMRRLSWRITVLERFRSIDSTRDIGAIAVRARTSAGPEVVAHCHTRNDGTCDVELDFSAELSGPIHAVVTAEASGAILAQGELTGDATGWGLSPGHPAHLTGSTSGDFAIDVYARRGIFAAPFRDELVVHVRDGEAPLGSARVTLRTDAADLDDATAASRVETNGADTSVTVVSSERGEITFGITPRMHAVAVDIDVGALGRSGGWHGILPVVPGAIWLDPGPLTHGKLRVVAPVPREFAYATLATPSARLWAGIIPLTADARGFAAGEIDWPGPPRPMAPPGGPPHPPENTWLTVASDPLASGAGTVGWPVPGESIRDERPFRDQLLLDGLPAAEKRDQDRRYRARALSAVALGAAAILEGVLLAHSAQARGVRAWAWTAIAIATVAFAFAAVGLVVMWKTSS